MVSAFGEDFDHGGNIHSSKDDYMGWKTIAFFVWLNSTTPFLVANVFKAILFIILRRGGLH